MQGADQSVRHDAYHGVRFYDNATSLAQIVGEFLGEGLTVSHPAIVVATEPQRLAIVRELAGKGLDVAELQRAGDLVLLDAQAMLDTFMADGMPDAVRFKDTMCAVLQRICRGRPGRPIRIYGQMVDVLWKQGQHDAALRLEMLWNHLAASEAFSLLCGYAMGSFYKDIHFDAICGQHTHVNGGARGDVERRLFPRRAASAKAADRPRRTKQGGAR
jgi:hypothetical protein